MKRWKKLWNRIRFKGAKPWGGVRVDVVEAGMAQQPAQDTEDVESLVHDQSVPQHIEAGTNVALHSHQSAATSSLRQDGGHEAVKEEDYHRAVEECHKARENWHNAWRKLDWVVEPDQIDYAIYSIIAAEKRYTALLKEVKGMREQLLS